MRGGSVLAILTTAITVVASAAAPTASVSHRDARTLALGHDRGIALTITVGTVLIVGEARSDVALEVVRHAPDAGSLARVPLTVEEQPTRIDIRAIQTERGSDPDLRSDVTLRVPAQTSIGPIRILEGRLDVRGLTGGITAEVQRGPIEAQAVSGAVRLETTIGSVIVHDARLVAGGVLRLRTFNGDVRLRLAERPTDARILALALNGTITSEIPLTMKNTWGPRWGEATLGRGEPVISIDVVTGKVEIKSP